MLIGLGYIDPLRPHGPEYGSPARTVLLVRAAVHRILNEIFRDAAIIQQRISLAGAAISHDPFPGPAWHSPEIR